MTPISPSPAFPDQPFPKGIFAHPKQKSESKVVKEILSSFIAFVFLFFFPGAPLCRENAPTPWWNNGWSCRRRVVVEEDFYKSARTDVAVAKFYTYGRLAPDARGLRVLDSRKNQVPFQLMFYHPDLYCILAFKRLPGDRYYWIYYDNPQAKKISGSWNPEAGVFLTTYRKKSGGAHYWKQMQRIFKQSRDQPSGAGYRGKIFDGYNPFGPSLNFVSRYLAYIDVPKDGPYLFCTASDDASFLLVDDNPVAEWPGWHGPHGGLHGQHRGKINLAKGVHKLSYYHLQGSDSTTCVAGWQPPGEAHVQLIPDQAFVPVLNTNCIQYDIRGQEAAPDMTIEQGETLNFKGNHYVMYRFNDVTTSLKEPSRRRWDFGDGVSTYEENPSHLYLTPGKKTVRLIHLTREGEKLEAGQTLEVYPNPYITKSDPFYLEGQFVKWIASYPLDSLSDRDLFAAVPLLMSEKREEAVRKVLEKRMSRRKAATSRRDVIAIGLLAEIYGEIEGQTPKAAAFLGEWIDKGRQGKPEIAMRAPLYLALARMQKNSRAALQTLQKLLTAESEIDPERRFELYTALGDAYMDTGDLKRANSFYLEVEGLTSEKRKQPPDFYKSSYTLTVESYLRSKKYGEAKEIIETWQKEYPTEKINGASLLLEAKLERAGKEYDHSNRILQELLENDPGSNLAREALYIQGSNYIALEEFEKAEDIFRRILNLYDDPTSRSELEARISYCEQKRSVKKANPK